MICEIYVSFDFYNERAIGYLFYRLRVTLRIEIPIKSVCNKSNWAHIKLWYGELIQYTCAAMGVDFS